MSRAYRKRSFRSDVLGSVMSDTRRSQGNGTCRQFAERTACGRSRQRNQGSGPTDELADKRLGGLSVEEYNRRILAQNGDFRHEVYKDVA